MLLELVKQDGHELHRSGAEHKILCPFHNDHDPSLHIVNKSGKEFFKCFACGAYGDAADYLVAYRKMSKRDALEMVGKGRLPDPQSKPEPAAAPVQEPPKAFDALPTNHSGRYIYRRANGSEAFAVQRYQIEGRKAFGHYTRARRRDGSLVWLKGYHLQGPRLLYLLPELLAADPKRVMVVEGEKCAEAVRANMRTPVTTWAGGAQGWRKTDFSPLHGRDLVLVADGDAEGHKAMEELGEFLAPDCGDVTLVCPPVNGKKWDIADELNRDSANIGQWLKAHVRRPPEPKYLAEAKAFQIREENAHGAIVVFKDGSEIFVAHKDLKRPAVLMGLVNNHIWWAGRIEKRNEKPLTDWVSNIDRRKK